jgi:hypothetical protein
LTAERSHYFAIAESGIPRRRRALDVRFNPSPSSRNVTDQRAVMRDSQLRKRLPSPLRCVGWFLLSLDGLAAYLFDDPKVPLPTIRKLANEGAIVDGGMIVSNPSIGTHGFLSTLPKMKAFCVLSGAGIHPGTHLPTIENVDIAPTIAQLLGIEYNNVDGKPLTSVMQ